MSAARSSPPDPVQVRPLSQPDLPALLGLIQALAEYEKMGGPDSEARERLARDALSAFLYRSAR